MSHYVQKHEAQTKEVGAGSFILFAEWRGNKSSDN